MKRACLVCLFQCLIATFLLSQLNPATSINQNTGVVPPIGGSQADQEAQGRILDTYGKLPLSFEANHGQADGRVQFLSRTGGYTLFLTADEAVLSLSGNAARKPVPKGATPPRAPQSETRGVLRMKLRGANPAARISGLDQLAGTSNYFIGNDPAKWRAGVPTYAKVKYEGIYSGIDLVYYGNQRQLEYDFIVAPGADPRRIAFDLRGARRIRQDAHGDLVLTMKMGDDEIRWHKPVVYQEKDGARQEIAARYTITDTNRVGFDLAAYDASQPLYIDPVVSHLIYSTYLGGNSYDQAFAIASDSGGNAYVTGYTASSNFPTMDPLQPANAGGGDAFVTKLNATGSALVYSTYLGGSAEEFGGTGIAVDSTGNAYVTGWTASTDFPTKNPLQAANAGGNDAFVAKLNATGSALVYSTYLGGSGNDQAWGITLDSAGNAYLTGGTTSTDFPTKNPLQAANGGSQNAFVAELNTAGSALVYSTYLGGSGYDQAYAIALDSAGNAYLTGSTDGSSNFPTTPGAYRTTCIDKCQYPEPFTTKINPTGSALVYSTYLGGTIFDVGYGVATDSAGYAYIVGTTSLDSLEAFLYRLNPQGSRLDGGHYGLNKSYGLGVAVDTSGDIYFTGSSNLRVFVLRLDHATGHVVSSVYLHGNGQESGFGIAVDNSYHAYVAGYTDSTNFPTKNPVQATFGGGGADAFVSEVDMRIVPTVTLSSSLNPSTYGQAVTFTAAVTSIIGAPPDGETVTFMKGTKVLGTGTLSGGAASFTTSTLAGGTNSIKAVYGGDSNLAPGTSKALSQVVNKATTTTTLTSSLNPSNFGQAVTFTASVAPQFGGTVKGTVTFSDGTTALATMSLSGGVAKFTTSKLSVGSHTITAQYNGNVDFDTSSASLTQQVN